jgi:hypothetical protein
MERKSSIRKIYGDYLDVVDSILAAYYDSTMGLATLLDFFERRQKKYVSEGKFTQEHLDKSNIHYVNGNPNDPNTKAILKCSQLEFKKKNFPSGKNYKIIGNMCLVLIYTYWEDQYRSTIAKDVLNSSNKNEVNLNIMKDLSKIRNLIIHHKGIADERVKECITLNWFKPSDEICINRDQLEFLVFQLRAGLMELEDRYGSPETEPKKER